MKTIHFNNNTKIINKIRGHYPTSMICAEPILHRIEYGEIKTEATGPIIRALFDSIEPIIQSNHDKVIMVHTWCNFFSTNQVMIKPIWHFDDPYFPVAYPNYIDDFPRNKQLIYTASDQPSGTSNTEFLTSDILVDGLTEKPIWDDISKRVYELDNKAYKCKDGDIIEYDNKTLHRATKSICSGWRLFVKIVFYDKKVYEVVKRIGWID